MSGPLLSKAEEDGTASVTVGEEVGEKQQDTHQLVVWPSS